MLNSTRRGTSQTRIDYRDNQGPLPSQQQEFRGRQKRTVTCFKCGEEGHYKQNCQTETTTQAAPSNSSRGNQINMIEEYSSDQTDSDYQRNLVNRDEYFSDGHYE